MVRRAGDQVADRALVEIVETNSVARPVAAAEGQEPIDLAIGRVDGVVDPVIDGTEREAGAEIAETVDQHPLVLLDAERLGKRDEVCCVARLVAPEIGRDVVEPLVVAPLRHQGHAFEGDRDHARVLRIDEGGADQLPSDAQLLAGELEACIGLAWRGDLILLRREIERSAAFGGA